MSSPPARGRSASDRQTLQLAYDVVQTQDDQQTYSEHEEVASDPNSGRYLAVVTIGDRRIETAWDGLVPAVDEDAVGRSPKTDRGHAGQKDAPPDGQVGLLRFMYETHRLSAAGGRESNGAKQ